MQDIQFHASGDYWRIGDSYDEFVDKLPRKDDPQFKNLFIALNFWNGWQDARDHSWLFYKGIFQNDWPTLAYALIADIEEDREITNTLILKYFDLRPKSRLKEKLKSLFKLKRSA